MNVVVMGTVDSFCLVDPVENLLVVSLDAVRLELDPIDDDSPVGIFATIPVN